MTIIDFIQEPSEHLVRWVLTGAVPTAHLGQLEAGVEGESGITTRFSNTVFRLFDTRAKRTVPHAKLLTLLGTNSGEVL